MQRNYKMDNIKFILIFLVIFGHLLELIGGGVVGSVENYIYKMIYVFHMPTFMFITGYFARFNQKKIIFSFIYPYIIFQILYLVFMAVVINGENSVNIQFTTPYWLLWYLLVIIFYYLLLPLFQNEDIKYQIYMLIGTVILSLYVNYDNTIGYYMSLSRFFTFLPYFLLGYYLSAKGGLKKLNEKRLLFVKGKLFAVIGVIVSFVYIRKVEFPSSVLYGSYPYEAVGHGPFTKLVLLILGICWIICLMMAVPDFKIPVISSFGRNTFAIFLMHGFVVKLAGKYGIFRYGFLVNMILAIMVSLLIITVFGNTWTSRIFNALFTGNWMIEIVEKQSTNCSGIAKKK